MKKGFFYKLGKKILILLFNVFRKKKMTKFYFRFFLKYKPNLKNPKTFNEKLCWLKLYYFPYQDDVVRCADKYLVREYIEKAGFGEYLNELYGVWDDARQIDFDKLPERFVLKCTHGSTYNIICADKKSLDIKKTVRQLNKWLKEDYGKFFAETHYRKTKRRIICEKYLGGAMSNYKFFCFNGEPEFMYLSRGILAEGGIKTAHFDKNKQPAPFWRHEFPKLENAELPASFDDMQSMSAALSKAFPFVRMDWFDVDGKIYFSEMTFTPTAAYCRFVPREYDKTFGELLDIKGLT